MEGVRQRLLRLGSRRVTEEGVLIIALLGDSSRDLLWTDAEKLLAKDFEKGTVIITDQSSYKVKPRTVNRSRTKRSKTRSL